MTEASFSRSVDNVGELYRFAETIFEAAEISQDVRFPIHLALEELFVNLVTYNTAGSRDILIDVETQDGGVTVTMTDFEAEDFDVTRSRGVDIEASLAERKPGGLGLHLIQHMVDTLEYEHRNHRSRIRFTKEAQQDDV
jgi:serine/threonine-protein kinase RsbW